MTETECIHRDIRGDRMATGDPPEPMTAMTWHQAVEVHYKALCKAAWFATGNKSEELAMDVAHQGMLKAQKGWDPERIRNPRTYLIRCVKHAGIDAYRAARRDGDRLVQGDGVLEAVGADDAANLDTDLWLFVQEELTEREWQVTFLFYIEGYSLAEIADELQISPGAVRVAKHRALTKLKTAFGSPDVLRRYLGLDAGEGES